MNFFLDILKKAVLILVNCTMAVEIYIISDKNHSLE